MLAYRVEDAFGTGPYNGPEWDGRQEMSSAHRDSEHSVPQRDQALAEVFRPGPHFCACETPGALLAWFDGWWDALATAGYAVSIYDAEWVAVGDRGQAVFDPDQADRAERLDIDTFRNRFQPDNL